MTTTTALPEHDGAAIVAAVDLVERRAATARHARTALDDAIRAAHHAGARDADVIRASGLAKDTVRRVLGKIEVKRPGNTRP